MNINYSEVPSNYNFDTEFGTYIIAFCQDVDSWFVTNKRFFFYEYKKEFNTYSDAKTYFMNNTDLFLSIRQNMSDCIPFYDLRESQLWFSEDENSVNVLGEN